MDKRIILAVAGSGKTYHLVEQLDYTRKFLIITYTNGNANNLRNAIIKRFGYIPANIKLKSYFTFLYSFCYKPFLATVIKSKGIYWKFPPEFTRNLKRSSDKFYLLNDKWLYHNRIAKLLIEKNIIPNIIKRLEKYYDCLFIDEVQDFGGHDFNFLSEMSACNLIILLVGDFFQHTFNTSNDGTVNINLHKSQIEYLQKYKDLDVVIDDKTLVYSRRCSSTVCDFVREKVGIEIYSNENRITEIRLIQDQDEADEIFKNKAIIKLFLQQHYSYDCYSDNWGNCKGLEFDNVCVVINDETLKFYNNNELSNLNATTKNKFYVACTRTKNNLYFVHQKFYKKHKKKLRTT